MVYLHVVEFLYHIFSALFFLIQRQILHNCLEVIVFLQKFLLQSYQRTCKSW